MLTKLLLFSTVTAAIASASPLVFNVSGQFASSDVADQLVTPNGHYSLVFTFDTTFTPTAVTSLGFNIPLANVTYTLNGSTSILTPNEIRFNTAANGGLLDLTFGSGLTAPEFEFQGAQAFTGTTAAPVFAPGSFNIFNWTFSDLQNFDSQSPVAQAATIALTPEPTSAGSMLAGAALTILATAFKTQRKR